MSPCIIIPVDCRAPVVSGSRRFLPSHTTACTATPPPPPSSPWWSVATSARPTTTTVVVIPLCYPLFPRPTRPPWNVTRPYYNAVDDGAYVHVHAYRLSSKMSMYDHYTVLYIVFRSEPGGVEVSTRNMSVQEKKVIAKYACKR